MFHGDIRRHLLLLSLGNWAIAIVCWTISAYLGVAAPTGIFVYTVLFVIGLFAAVVGIAAFVLADFGRAPARPAVEAAEAPAVEKAERPAVEKAETPARPAAEAPAVRRAGKPAVKKAEKPAAEQAAEQAAEPGASPSPDERPRPRGRESETDD